MTKSELLEMFKELEDVKDVHIEGINASSNKNEIENAIDCLNCPDKKLDKYLVVLSLKFENTGRKIVENGDFKKHPFNRLYVYNTARQILAAY